MISRWPIIICLLLCFWVIFPTTGVFGKDPDAKKNMVDRDTPIQISSDRMDIYNDRGTVVFDGNAIATQGERTIRSATITLFYKRKTESGARDGVMDIHQKSDLDRIEAKGNVRITQGERVVTGNEAVYLQDTQQIIIKGDAVLNEGENVIRGDRVVVFLNENRGIVESSTKQRVNATIFPSRKKETKP
ncbi:MAG: LptA/OstA family protein [Syntrophales bacterium]|nr:LptA/OstA family protein [Syntrophales bacterium]